MTSGRPQSDQERLWRGPFGSEYISRNVPDDAKLAALSVHWARVLRGTVGEPPRSLLEVGANIGLNLRALSRVTTADLYALEPNEDARARLRKDAVLPADRIFDGVASNIPMGDGQADLVMTSGVLIHIHPDDLLASCSEIVRVARRWVVCAEYFSDVEQEVLYRGHQAALFKRDFGAFYLDNFPDLTLVDYGFAWKRATGLDNLTWWLFRKH